MSLRKFEICLAGPNLFAIDKKGMVFLQAYLYVNNISTSASHQNDESPQVHSLIAMVDDNSSSKQRKFYCIENMQKIACLFTCLFIRL